MSGGSLKSLVTIALTLASTDFPTQVRAARRHGDFFGPTDESLGWETIDTIFTHLEGISEKMEFSLFKGNQDYYASEEYIARPIAELGGEIFWCDTVYVTSHSTKLESQRQLDLIRLSYVAWQPGACFVNVWHPGLHGRVRRLKKLENPSSAQHFVQAAQKYLAAVAISEMAFQRNFVNENYECPWVVLLDDFTLPATLQTSLRELHYSISKAHLKRASLDPDAQFPEAASNYSLILSTDAVSGSLHDAAIAFRPSRLIQAVFASVVEMVDRKAREWIHGKEKAKFPAEVATREPSDFLRRVINHLTGLDDYAAKALTAGYHDVGVSRLDGGPRPLLTSRHLSLGNFSIFADEFEGPIWRLYFDSPEQLPSADPENDPNAEYLAVVDPRQMAPSACPAALALGAVDKDETGRWHPGDLFVDFNQCGTRGYVSCVFRSLVDGASFPSPDENRDWNAWRRYCI